MDGTPVRLLKGGAWVDEVMQGMKLVLEDIMDAAWIKGIKSIFEVEYAILEGNGTISTIKAKKGDT